MTTLRRCPVCRHTVSSEDCTHCPECSAVLSFDRPVADRAVQDILQNVKQQIDAIDDAADDAGPVDRDIAAILSGRDFQSLLGESSNDGEDMPAGQASGEPLSGGPAAPPGAPGGSLGNEQPDSPSDSAPDAAGRQSPSPFGAALGSLKHTPAAPDAEEPQRGSDIWDRYSFLLDDGPDSGGAATPPEPGALKPRTWWGLTRQSLYLLLVLLACIILFRLFAPKKKEYTIGDFFQPGKTDVEFLDAIEYLEKYYERHPELKRGTVVQQAAEDRAESEAASRFRGGSESGETAQVTESSEESAP